MYSVKVNGGESIKCGLTINAGKFECELNNKTLAGDFIKINAFQYHFIISNTSYSVDILKLNKEEKSLYIKLNDQRFQLALKDKYDELLHNLGLDELNTKKVNDIKAPMPGMVIKVLVKEGELVKKGDAILVLEAMKMENILKSPSDGIVKKVAISTGTAVEKNQLLIQF